MEVIVFILKGVTVLHKKANIQFVSYQFSSVKVPDISQRFSTVALNNERMFEESENTSAKRL